MPKKKDNLEEIDKFLEKHKPPSLNQEEIENPKRQVTIMEIQTALKNLPREKTTTTTTTTTTKQTRTRWLHK